MTTTLSRRHVLAGGAALGLGLMGSGARAAGSIVATTYPGTWETAHRQFLLPAFKKASGEDVALQPVLALDAIAKITASRNNPPFDVIILDEGPYLAARESGIFAPLAKDKIPNFVDLPEQFIDPNGTGAFISAQVLGITYNPDRIQTPPSSWADLWKPEYKGRVGITGLGSSLGSAWLVEIAKMHGGSEKNLEPGFKAIADLLPNLGAIAANPGALATLFQQGQIDISFNYLNGILPLAERGVPIAFARPDTGYVLVRNSMHVVKGTQNYEAACKYVDAALSAQVQGAMAGSPNYLAPTNRNVGFGAELKKIAANNAELAKLTVTDWATLNPQRSALIDRFNKEVRI